MKMMLNLLWPLFFATSPVRALVVNDSGSSSGACVLPPYPLHGRYSVADVQNPAPGQHYNNVNLTVFCDPGYVVQGTSVLTCLKGTWSEDIPNCVECGTVSPSEEQLIVGGESTPARRGELPWHADIYSKLMFPYMQICGGSLVTSSVIITAAQCFWGNEIKPASDYVVAVGKIYRPWNYEEVDVQRSDVRDIKVPARFTGLTTNFQEDIALVFLSTPIQFNTFVRPVCLDFDVTLNNKQLQEGKLGKVPSWGLTAGDSSPSQVLKVVNLPYIDILRCITDTPPGFRAFITSDKICAGCANGSAVCSGDSGGGYVFPDSDSGTPRYYLRGVVSIAQTSAKNSCANGYIIITEIAKHEQLIRRYVF